MSGSLPANTGNYFRYGNIGQTGSTATTASDAQRFFKGLHKSPVFMIVAILETCMAVWSKVVASGNLGKINQIT
jgi:hypothetical protein